MPKFEGRESYLVAGIHEATITEQVFDTVQRNLNAQRETAAKQSQPSDRFSFRRLVLCQFCGKRLTGSRSKGKKSYYYHCHHCRQFRANADGIHKVFIDILDRLKVGNIYQEVYGKLLAIYKQSLFDREEDNQRRQVQGTDRLIERILKAKELQIKGEIDNEDFCLIRKDCEGKINAIGLNLQRSTHLKESSRQVNKCDGFLLSQIGKGGMHLILIRKGN